MGADGGVLRLKYTTDCVAAPLNVVGDIGATTSEEQAVSAGTTVGGRRPVEAERPATA